MSLCKAIASFLLGLFVAVATANAGLHDMVEVLVTGFPGTGTFTLGAAVSPFVGPATGGVTSGETVTYAAQDTVGNWERGRAPWTSGGTNGTLTRGSTACASPPTTAVPCIISSSNSNALVNYSATSPTVWITLAAEDAVTTVYPNVELSLNSQPLCLLTDAATVLVNAANCSADATKSPAYNSLTLTASGHVIGCPTGASVSGSNILFDINEGAAGPFKVSMAGCYYVPPAFLDTQGNLILGNIASGENLVDCQLKGLSTGNGFPVQYTCGSIQAGIGSATVYVANTPTLGTSCTGPATTCTAATQITAGDILAIWAQDCGNSSSCSSGSLVSLAATPVSGTGLSGCTVFTGSEGGANGFFGHWAYCSITTSGSPTVTVTWASNSNFMTVALFDLHNAAASPDAGIGHVASGSAATTASDTTNGNTQQSNGFILSGTVAVSATAFIPAVGANVLVNNTSDSLLIQSQNVYAPGATFAATAGWTTSSNWDMSVVQVLHK